MLKIIDNWFDLSYRVVAVVAGNSEAVTLFGLSPDTQYQLTVTAVWSGRKYRSRPIVFRTLGEFFYQPVWSEDYVQLLETVRHHSTWIQGFKDWMPSPRVLRLRIHVNNLHVSFCPLSLSTASTPYKCSANQEYSFHKIKLFHIFFCRAAKKFAATGFSCWKRQWSTDTATRWKRSCRHFHRRLWQFNSE